MTVDAQDQRHLHMIRLHRQYGRYTDEQHRESLTDHDGSQFWTSENKTWKSVYTIESEFDEYSQ